jgi:hypothetical protein
VFGICFVQKKGRSRCLRIQLRPCPLPQRRGTQYRQRNCENKFTLHSLPMQGVFHMQVSGVPALPCLAGTRQCTPRLAFRAKPWLPCDATTLLPYQYCSIHRCSVPLMACFFRPCLPCHARPYLASPQATARDKSYPTSPHLPGLLMSVRILSVRCTPSLVPSRPAMSRLPCLVFSQLIRASQARQWLFVAVARG